ncbi:hypothetical protein [Actinomyces marmotae]|uniref:Uncharacterized protein n=1 Tax=Actinomyces marmotae TaxID=2737173 RepID=A0A6M8B671_9ACTO|nr:hypothetical protein [Actinomyces marmotae]QKD80080.1 hypothetical protein HPC72_07485 [Actinomyces marmotae]
MSTDRVIRVLSGRDGAHVLALWGLVSLLPGARLRFDADAIAHLTWDGDDDALGVTAARGLVERTWGLGDGLLAGIKTTVPKRSAVNPKTEAEWRAVEQAGRLPTTSILAVFNAAATGEDKKGKIQDGDLKVVSSALTMLSGRSYTANIVQETWRLLEVEDADGARARAAVEIGRLLDGGLSIASSKPGLRFSAPVTPPRVASGSERVDIQPLVDLLAFTGQLLLSPAQRPFDPAAGDKALAWVLNPVPLDLAGLLDLSAAPPRSLAWPRYEAPIVSEGGRASISALKPAHPVTPASHRGSPNA